MNDKQRLYEVRHICENCQFYEKFADKCKIGSIKNNLDGCEGICKNWRKDVVNR